MFKRIVREGVASKKYGLHCRNRNSMYVDFASKLCIRLYKIGAYMEIIKQERAYSFFGYRQLPDSVDFGYNQLQLDSRYKNVHDKFHELSLEGVACKEQECELGRYNLHYVGFFQQIDFCHFST